MMGKGKQQPELDVVRVPLAELHGYEGNAKRHTSAQLDAVRKSIDEFGFVNPVLAWHDAEGRAVIVAGHARCQAARKEGMDEVPVVFVDHLGDAQRRALTLADNQTTMMTGWDVDTLKAELDALADEFDMADFGFDLEQMSGDDDVEVTEDEPDEDAEDRVGPGELWRMGGHVLVCGDSTDPDVIARLMAAMPEAGGAASADLLLTDPPYNVALGQHDRPSEAKQLHRRTDGLVIANDSWGSDEGFVEFLRGALAVAMGVMRPGAAFYVWYASMQSANFLEAAKRAGMDVRQILVWAKSTFALGRQDYQWRHELCLYGWKGGASHYFTDSRKETTVIADDRRPQGMSKA